MIERFRKPVVLCSVLGAFLLASVAFASHPGLQITSGPSGPTNSTTVRFEFSEPGPTDPVFECSVTDAGATGPAWQSCSSGPSGATSSSGWTGYHDFSGSGEGALGLGNTYKFEVKIADDGATPTTVNRSFLIDTVAPYAGWPGTSLDSGPYGFETDGTEATFNMYTHPFDEGAVFECNFDSGGWYSCPAQTTVTFGAGTHRFSVRAIDQAGNVQQFPRHTDFISPKPPRGPGPPGPEPAKLNQQPDTNITNIKPHRKFKFGSGRLRIKGTASDDTFIRYVTAQVAIIKLGGAAKSSRVGKARCSYMSFGGSFRSIKPSKRARCRPEERSWMATKGFQNWSFSPSRSLPRGRYIIFSRGVDYFLLTEKSFSIKDRNLIPITVR